MRCISIQKILCTRLNNEVNCFHFSSLHLYNIDTHARAHSLKKRKKWAKLRSIFISIFDQYSGPEDDFDKYGNGFGLSSVEYMFACIHVYDVWPTKMDDVDFVNMVLTRDLKLRGRSVEGKERREEFIRKNSERRGRRRRDNNNDYHYCVLSLSRYAIYLGL